MKRFEFDDVMDFGEFFKAVDDETLGYLYMTNPQSVYDMCMFLSLDEQLKKEHKEHLN